MKTTVFRSLPAYILRYIFKIRQLFFFLSFWGHKPYYMKVEQTKYLNLDLPSFRQREFLSCLLPSGRGHRCAGVGGVVVGAEIAACRWEEKEGVSVRRRGRPRKQQNMEGKKLFDDESSSEDEDSISEYGKDVHDEGGRQEEDDEDAPLINSIKSSSKLRWLGNKGQTKAGTSVRAVDDLSASRTSGASN